ncbi:MAG: 2-isopropylmalate synthase [Myxococcota bacterium]|nr:2-isopropylmalate synthase [Myxococcota bacterium]
MKEKTIQPTELAMDVIFDWNELKHPSAVILPGFELVDETLRDGIQSPSIRNPSIDEKLELLHLMESCGIENVDVGLPATSDEAKQHVTRLCEEIRDHKMAIKPNCAARTHPNDIQAIIDISQKTGVPIEVCAFLGASPIRRILEGWDPSRMVKMATDSAKLAVNAGLPFSFVTEDTTRSDPHTLDMLFRSAIDHGATRLILTDTVGHATPDGLRNLVDFTQSLIRGCAADVQVDWHGHNDRGLSLTLCLSALEYGVHRVHGTCMGVGERVGNASIDMLLVNLKMLGIIDRDLTPLGDYVRKVSEYYEVPLPYNYPVFGHDAYRTATGVHASAIVKALEANRPDFADRVYSSVPASDYGCKQIIEVGFCSGKANVQCWLRQHNLEPTEERVHVILEHAKQKDHILSQEEIISSMIKAGVLSPTDAEAIL